VQAVVAIPRQPGGAAGGAGDRGVAVPRVVGVGRGLCGRFVNAREAIAVRVVGVAQGAAEGVGFSDDAVAAVPTAGDGARAAAGEAVFDGLYVAVGVVNPLGGGGFASGRGAVGC